VALTVGVLNVHHTELVTMYVCIILKTKLTKEVADITMCM